MLVVDDDPDIRGMLAFVLEDEGHAVRVAADGESGVVANAPKKVILAAPDRSL